MRLFGLALALLILSGLSAKAEAKNPRFQVEVYFVGEVNGIDKDAVNISRQWMGILAGDIVDDLSHSIPRPLIQSEGHYLRSFVIDVLHAEDQQMPLAKREEEWNTHKLLHLIESYSSKEATGHVAWHGYIYLGSLGSALNAETVKLEDSIDVSKLENAGNILKLLTLYTLIEDAVVTDRSNLLICTLVSIENNYSSDLSDPLTHNPQSDLTASEKSLFGLLVPVLKKRSEERCPNLQ